MSSKGAKRRRQQRPIEATAARGADARSARVLSGLGGVDASHRSAGAGGRFKMLINNQTTTIEADAACFLDALSILSSLLGSGNLPLQFLDAVLNFLDSLGKFARITIITAVGTGITIRFESADVLLALMTALRTGNLDSFFLEHGKQGFQIFCSH
jgi:hypothetical protein